jgi:hypothetical protein
MRRQEVLAYLKKKLKKESNHPMEEEKKSRPANKSEAEESKRVKSAAKKRSGFHVRKSEQDEVDEIIDGDEGIVNRKLPINYHHY